MLQKSLTTTVWEQRLTIHYNCIGVIDIPDILPIPKTQVSMNTRKGVVVNYAPTPNANETNTVD